MSSWGAGKHPQPQTLGRVGSMGRIYIFPKALCLKTRFMRPKLSGMIPVRISSFRHSPVTNTGQAPDRYREQEWREQRRGNFSRNLPIRLHGPSHKNGRTPFSPFVHDSIIRGSCNLTVSNQHLQPSSTTTSQPLALQQISTLQHAVPNCYHCRKSEFPT